jgi:hypothetical protein
MVLNAHVTKDRFYEGPVGVSYCDGFAQGIAEQRSRGTPAG